MRETVACAVVRGPQFPGVERQPFANVDARGGVVLIGTLCRQCGKLAFPPRLRCVACYSGDLDTASLSQHGHVLASTIVRQRPDGYRGPLPYVLGQVDVGGVTVLAHLVGRNPDTWRPNDAVEACSMTLGDGDGEPALSYAFRPILEDLGDSARSGR